MEKKNKLKAATLSPIILCSIIALIYLESFNAKASKSSYDSDYLTVSGVLSTDYYVLFPFEKKNLTIGFSKYGEMIDYETKVGLDYNDETDPFATDPSQVYEYEWVNGWVINITYVHGGDYYNRWAFALYSDYYNENSIAGDWKEGVIGATNTTYLGGRKTNGGAVTQPIKVLYNGPRRFVALLNTTIYEDTSHSYPLVRIIFTIVFNKVEKQVVVFKDIKRVDNRKGTGVMQIEFSERGQWDLGSGTPPKSYAYIHTQQSTLYNEEYQSWYNGSTSAYKGKYDVVQIIDDDLSHVAWAAWWPRPLVSYVEDISEIGRATILKTFSTKEQNFTGDGSTTAFTLTGDPDPYPRNKTSNGWDDSPMVFVNDDHKSEGTDYTWDADNNRITFTSAPASGAAIKVVYKDTVDSQSDPSNEPCVPFVVAEWCWDTDDATDMFRAVTVYGITDLHDGSDADITGGSNTIDSEVDYYLDRVFNPYDLYSVVHKDTRRWVDFHNVTSAEVSAERVSFNLTHKPVIYTSDWTEYCNFSEKVEWDGELKTPYRARNTFGGGYNYTFYYDSSDGTGNITITGDNVPAEGTIIKVLYSTNATWEQAKTDLGTFGNVSLTEDLSATVTLIPNNVINSTTWTDPFGTTYNITLLYDRMYAEPFSVNNTDDIHLTLDIKVRPESSYVKVHNITYYGYWINGSLTQLVFYGNMSVMFTVTPSNTEQTYRFNYTEHLHITGDILLRVNHTTVSGATDYEIANYTVVYANLTTSIGGSYEWIIVGKDAATIDSLGAAYITEAFDSIKEIKVCAAGMDVNDTSFGPYSPFVMGGASSGSRADYRDSLGRSSLQDDWCRRIYMSGGTQYTYPGYPISTSNMIFEGGPIAQLGTEYFNEFTDAFFAFSTYVVNDTGHSNKILALSCWARNATGGGYAVIAVYKDLNGTIGLVIWGYNGDDTYYASKWFWDGLGRTPGIVYLQSENRGVTAIVLKITYSSADPIHPTISIVERLGTISEKDQHDP
ncbi:MAG: hypothetical protein QHH17_03560 [Candidatus Bathyarchaeota archaeon]|nr:hypothetical protein [Candidatus Bathyarchaeota archaeon]